MLTKSIWHSFSETTNFPSLKENLKADVAIIGGGITGITTAQKLSKRGLKVVVLEAAKVGAGTTSHSTGNLYSTIDKQLDSLLSKYSTKTVSNIVEARSDAINIIEQNVQNLEIDCDFKRQSWYLFASQEEQNQKIEKELENANKIIFPVTKASSDEIPFPVTAAVKAANQAQFNPMLYVQGLAKSIHSDNCRIYEHTHVHEIKEHGSFIEVFADSAIVEAEHVVHATHTPKGIKFVHTLLGPYREYGISCKIDEGAHPEGIFWGYFDGNDKISTRTYNRENETYLLVVGKPHKTGHAKSNVKYIKDLEDFARFHFDVNETMHRWGGQHYRPADGIPYIGREKTDSNIYVATGFSTDGLVYGTLGASILSDLISDVKNPWHHLFDSTRNQPLKAAENFIKENMDVAKQFLKYVPGAYKDSEFASLAPGEGKVLARDGGKVAVFKNNEGKIYACSAICTHMGCIVNWNNAEKTWDCPCHASRFKPDGTVLEGPALKPLRTIKIADERQ